MQHVIESILNAHQKRNGFMLCTCGENLVKFGGSVVSHQADILTEYINNVRPKL